MKTIKAIVNLSFKRIMLVVMVPLFCLGYICGYLRMAFGAGFELADSHLSRNVYKHRDRILSRERKEKEK